MARLVVERNMFDFNPESSGARGWRVIFWFAIGYLIFFPASLVLAPSEANLYTDFVDGSSSFDGVFSGKDAVAFAYAAINRFVPYTIVTSLITIGYYLAIALTARNLETVVLHAFISIQILAFSPYITKESVLILIAIVVFFLHRKGWPVLGRTFFFLAVMGFAVVVRPYYVPLLVLFALALVLNPGRAAVLTLIGFCLFSLIDDAIIQRLTDVKNHQLVRTHLRFTGAATALPFDLLYETQLLPFLEHYFKSLLRVMAPVMWLLDPRALYAQLQVVLLTYLAIAALRNGDRGYATFGIGLIFTMAYIVPDLGTWVRHASTGSVFLYLALMTRPSHAPDITVDDPPANRTVYARAPTNFSAE